MYCYYYVLWLFLTVPWVGLQFLIVVFPDHTGFVFYMQYTDGGQNYSSLSFFLYVLTSEAQWVTCLATDACLTADPGAWVRSPAWSHTFVEIDHEIISRVILLPSAESCPGKSMVEWTDRPAMTKAVAWDVKQQNQHLKRCVSRLFL